MYHLEEQLQPLRIHLDVDVDVLTTKGLQEAKPGVELGPTGRTRGKVGAEYLNSRRFGTTRHCGVCMKLQVGHLDDGITSARVSVCVGFLLSQVHPMGALSPCHDETS